MYTITEKDLQRLKVRARKGGELAGLVGTIKELDGLAVHRLDVMELLQAQHGYVYERLGGWAVVSQIVNAYQGDNYDELVKVLKAGELTTLPQPGNNIELTNGYYFTY